MTVSVATTISPHLLRGTVKGLEYFNLKTKLLILPKLTLGKAIAAGSQAFRAFEQLVAIRHALVHYKMIAKAPSPVADLKQRKIALAPRPHEGWPDAISTVKGMVWAHNVAAGMVMELRALFGPEWEVAHRLLGNFSLNPDSWIAEALRRRKQQQASK